MAQGLPPKRAARDSDRDHATEAGVPDLPMLVLVLSLFLTLVTLLAAPLSAQSQAQVQVAARVVVTEPSRQALALAAQPGTQPRRSQLATVRVVRETPNRRVVAVDFVRN
jgi:hypothetical protein